MNENGSPDPEREMLAKRHRKSSPFTQIFRITCLKSGRRLSCESHHERDYIQFLGTDSDVVSCVTELESVVAGRYRYTPDIAQLMTDGSLVYIEIKSDQTADDPKFKQKFADKVAFYANHGSELRLVRRSDFPGDDYMTNMKTLHIYATGEPPLQAEIDMFDRLLKPGEEALLCTLTASMSKQRMTSHAIWYALAKGLCSTNLHKPITDYSMISREE